LRRGLAREAVQHESPPGIISEMLGTGFRIAGFYSLLLRASPPEQFVEETLFVTWDGHLHGFAPKPSCGIDIGARKRAPRLAEGDERTEIRGAQHLLAFWNDPK